MAPGRLGALLLPRLPCSRRLPSTPADLVCELIRLLREGESRGARSRAAGQPAPSLSPSLPAQHPAASTAGSQHPSPRGTALAGRWSGRAHRGRGGPASRVSPGPRQAASGEGRHWGGSLAVLPAPPPRSWDGGRWGHGPGGTGSVEKPGPGQTGFVWPAEREEQARGRRGKRRCPSLAMQPAPRRGGSTCVARAMQPGRSPRHGADAQGSLQSWWLRDQGVKPAWQKPSGVLDA